MRRAVLPSVAELTILSNVIRKTYRAAGLGTDGKSLPPLGESRLHEQFGAMLLRMSEARFMTYGEFAERSRVFSYQLQELGDEVFAAALAKESPEVIAAVGVILSRRNQVTSEGLPTEEPDESSRTKKLSSFDQWFELMLGSIADKYPRTKAVIRSVPKIDFPARFMTHAEELKFYGNE